MIVGGDGEGKSSFMAMAMAVAIWSGVKEPHFVARIHGKILLEIKLTVLEVKELN